MLAAVDTVLCTLAQATKRALSLTQCAECGAPATRVFYPVGIVFKGQGFDKTDSRGSGSSVLR